MNPTPAESDQPVHSLVDPAGRARTLAHRVVAASLVLLALAGVMWAWTTGATGSLAGLGYVVAVLVGAPAVAGLGVAVLALSTPSSDPHAALRRANAAVWLVAGPVLAYVLGWLYFFALAQLPG